jgi:dephospho-CoA kinase
VLVVGLTGGIGSGKSALAAAFAELGVPVVDADVVARRCVEPGTPGLAAIAERFGDIVLTADGALDRARLADIVFADEAARRDLEAITHPCIRSGIEADLAALRAEAERPEMAVVEHPLLVETGTDRRVDRVIVVEAPIELRIERLVAHRGMTASAARARIEAQADDATRRAVADHVVINDGALERLRAEASRLVALLSLEEGRA